MESSWLVSGYRVQGLGLEVGKGVRLEPMILLVMGGPSFQLLLSVYGYVTLMWSRLFKKWTAGGTGGDTSGSCMRKWRSRISGVLLWQKQISPPPVMQFPGPWNLRLRGTLMSEQSNHGVWSQVSSR